MTTTTIEQFREQCLEIVKRYCGTSCRSDVISDIAALPLPVMPSQDAEVMPEQAEPVTWIECSDRMPEDGKNVLAIIYLTARPHAKMIRIINYPINLDFIVLTHWMPLPELPKD